VVCVKQVPDTAVERTLTPGAGTLGLETPDGLINKLDEYAIEEGLKIAWCSPMRTPRSRRLRADRRASQAT
jgi:electron transfer flavoprotein alpha/beta subunit